MKNHFSIQLLIILVSWPALLSCAYSSKKYSRVGSIDPEIVETTLVLSKVFGSLDEFTIRNYSKNSGDSTKLKLEYKRWGFWRKAEDSDSIWLTISSPSYAYKSLYGVKIGDSLHLRYRLIDGSEGEFGGFRLTSK